MDNSQSKFEERRRKPEKLDSVQASRRKFEACRSKSEQVGESRKSWTQSKQARASSKQVGASHRASRRKSEKIRENLRSSRKSAQSEQLEAIPASRGKLDKKSRRQFGASLDKVGVISEQVGQQKPEKTEPIVASWNKLQQVGVEAVEVTSQSTGSCRTEFGSSRNKPVHCKKEVWGTDVLHPAPPVPQ